MPDWLHAFLGSPLHQGSAKPRGKPVSARTIPPEAAQQPSVGLGRAGRNQPRRRPFDWLLRAGLDASIVDSQSPYEHRLAEAQFGTIQGMHRQSTRRQYADRRMTAIAPDFLQPRLGGPPSGHEDLSSPSDRIKILLQRCEQRLGRRVMGTRCIDVTNPLHALMCHIATSRSIAG